MDYMDTMPTHEDANLILRLYELRREETLRKARQWFVQNFHVTDWASLQSIAPPGSQENAYFRMVVSYWEMAASFVASGVLNQELFFQSNQELLLVWTRVSGSIADFRKTMNSPRMWKNLETVAMAYIDYWERNAPGAYAAFQKRMGPPAPKPASS
jgi:hypothetical protein